MGRVNRHIRTGGIAGLALVAAVGAALSAGGNAQAGGGGIDAKAEQVRAIEHELYTLGAGAERAAVAANDARARADAAEKRLAQNAKKLREARRALAISRTRLSDRLVSIYKEETPGLVEIVLTSGGLTSAVDAHAQLSRAGEQDARVLENVRASRVRLAKVRTSLEAQREEAASEAARAAAERAQLEQLLSQRSSVLASARAELGRLLAERERQRQLAAIAAQQAAQAEQLREVATGSSGGGGAASPSGGESNGLPSGGAGAPQAPVSAPSPGSTGGVEGTLDKIAQCESGGNPSAVSPSGQYRGKYQFHPDTWRAVGGTGDPATAPEAEQDRRAADLLRQSGASPWPVCGS